MSNSTLINRNGDLYYYADSFPLPYEDYDSALDSSSSSSVNRSLFDDLFSNNTHASNLTLTDSFSISSLFSLSSPFAYILLILIVYSVLTLILLLFSLYKQRQTDLENFYFGDTEEEIEQAKRYLTWKQFLIGKISKGDMEPLLNGSISELDGSTKATFPLYIV